MPSMTKKAHAGELKRALESRGQGTEGQIERLERVLEMLDVPAHSRKCETIKGVLSEAKERMKEIEDEDMLDASVISSPRPSSITNLPYGTLIDAAKTSARMAQLSYSGKPSSRKKMTIGCWRRSPDRHRTTRLRPESFRRSPKNAVRRSRVERASRSRHRYNSAPDFSRKSHLISIFFGAKFLQEVCKVGLCGFPLPRLAR